MTTGLSDFFQYNLWAHLRLLDTCESLSDAQLDMTMSGTFGSIRETMLHMLTAEEGYTRTLTGKTPDVPLGDLTQFPYFDELRRRVTWSGNAFVAFAEQAEPATLSQILHLDGGTYDAPMIVVVIQVINHAIDHRSQISTLLAQQGIELPNIDTWAYNDAMQ